MYTILMQAGLIFWWIILLTFLQKYHYKILNFLTKNTHIIIKKIFRFFIRIWIIIHELCHLFFWVLSWSKVKNINLFSKNWWSVTFETKNYIWALSQHYDKPGFIFMLFLNQIGIFLTSLWPLIFWIFVTFLLQDKLQVPLSFSQVNDFLWSLSGENIAYLAIYFLLIPSFALSVQDIKHFVISRQSWLGATIVGSIINMIIFSLFVIFLTIFYELFILFFIFYIIIFIILLLWAGLKIILTYLYKLWKKSFSS